MVAVPPCSGVCTCRRMGLSLLRPPARTVERHLEVSVGPGTRARALRPCELGFPARTGAHLRRRVRLARRPDPRTRGQRGCSSPRALPWRARRPFRCPRLFRRANAVLAESERYSARRRRVGRRGASSTGCRRRGRSSRADRALRAVPVLHACWAGLHGVPVGHATARGGLSRDLPDRRLAHRRVAVSMARVPLPVHGGRGQARVRRLDMANPHRARLSLLDAAAADTARVVRGPVSARPAGRLDGRDPHRRSRSPSNS